MLDLNDFNKDRGGNPEKIKESQRRRHADETLVDKVIEQWQAHRKLQYDADELRRELKKLQKSIGERMKAKEDAKDLLEQKAQQEAKIKEADVVVVAAHNEMQKTAKSIGNYVHDSVPISDNEDNNTQIRTWSPNGNAPEKKNCLSHHEVLTRLDGYDPERGVKIVGHRGYCLTGYGLFLNLALINYGLEFLHARGYKPNQPPYFMLREAMAKTAQLEQFDEELYKVEEKVGDKDSEKYLIATSEQPLSALHEGEWLDNKDLPIKYAGYSTCFRKEAGSHGKDAWGIFRVHQFEKVPFTLS